MQKPSGCIIENVIHSGGVFMPKIINKGAINRFAIYLYSEEKSDNTVSKYLHDIRVFFEYAEGRDINKALVIAYKTFLAEHYAISSANSMIAALNAFLRFQGCADYCVKQYKVQRRVCCSEEEELTKAEYIRLVQAAKKSGNNRLNLILQTICGTGIRVSELQYITLEAVRNGEAIVNCKGKTRIIIIVKELRERLLQYAKMCNLTSGSVFVTRNGKPINRSNIWREMKKLCERANVSPNKVFPHNLRHLFARIFYSIEKDIAKLADILGHASINTTRIYMITTSAEHRRKLENMRLII